MKASAAQHKRKRRGTRGTAEEESQDGDPDRDEDDGESDDADGEVDHDMGDESGAVVQVEMMDDDADAEGEPDDSQDLDGASQGAEPQIFSKEQEIEKLRTHGSMTQSVHEIARVKNFDKIQIGKHEVEAWYFSPYPVRPFPSSSRLSPY